MYRDQTLLMIACKNDNEDIVRYLMEYGADINLIKEYCSLLMRVFFNNNRTRRRCKL